MTNEIEILIQALRIESESDREAFIVGVGEDNPELLAFIRNALLRDTELLAIAPELDDRSLRERIEQLLADESPTSLHDLDERTQTIGRASDSSFPNSQETIEYEHRLGEGTTIAGRYELQRIIGEGGMGEVWSAKQIAPVKRRVAVKLIKKGMDSQAVLSRFEQERQALAMMDHPNIAQVLDGGLTESGQSYFVMELVNGLPLTKFADQTKLSPRERLELFVSICNAVQHAHQKGIIHRDLKPANILVTMIDGQPVPKVIDFGVAKATGGNLTDESIETQFGMVIGTLEYMSPEQAGYSGVDIDTRADIYSLGVILYELLTGLRPIDQNRLKKKGLAEMIRVIKEDEPSKPSTRLSTNESLPSVAAVRRIDPRRLTALLRGDLDWVVMKCLEKTRDRRYETANGLAKDIERFLTGDAVEARPASFSYRFSKFLKRNQRSVMAASFVFIALIAGITGTTLAMFEAWRQEEIAIEQTAEKELARLAEAERAEGERLAKIEAVKNLAEAKKQEKLALEQKELAEMNAKIAEKRLEQIEQATNSLIGVFKNLDPYSEEKEGLPLRQILAKNLSQTATSLLQLTDADPIAIAKMQALLGGAMSDLGDVEEGTQVLELALKAFRENAGPDNIETLNTANKLALSYRDADRIEEALELLLDTLERLQTTRGGIDIDTLACMNNLAITYKTAGKMDKAMPIYIQVEAETRKLMGDDDQATLAAINDLAMAHVEHGQLQKALPLYLEALERARTALLSDHPFTLNTMNNLANLYGQASQHDKSIPLYEEALAGRRKKLGPTHPLTLQTLNNLGMSYTAIGKPDQAVPLLEEALAGRKARFGDDHRTTMRTMQMLAEAYIPAGKTEQGFQMLSDLLVQTEKVAGADHPDTMYLMNNLAVMYWQSKQLAKSVPLFKRLLPLHQKKMGSDHPLTINVQANLAVNLRDSGELVEAIELLEDAVKRMEKHPPLNVARLSWVPIVLNQTYEQNGQHDKAEPGYRRSLDDAVKKFGDDSLESATAATLLGVNLLKQSKFAEAGKVLDQALSIRETGAPQQWTTFNTQSLLGESLLGQKEYEAAEMLLLEGYQELEKRKSDIPANAKIRLPEAVARIVKLYEAMEKPEDVKKWKEVLKSYE